MASWEEGHVTALGLICRTLGSVFIDLGLGVYGINLENMKRKNWFFDHLSEL